MGEAGWLSLCHNNIMLWLLVYTVHVLVIQVLYVHYTTLALGNINAIVPLQLAGKYLVSAQQACICSRPVLREY